MEIKKRLGKRIQELRVKNNLKQSELAEKIDIATKTQSCIETGKNFPSADTLEKYAGALGVDIADILDISHIQDREELLSDMISMLNSASDGELVTSYRVLKGILR